MPNDKLLLGYTEVAEFLTAHGYRISKQTITRLGARGEGPPPAGSWANAHMFSPAEVLAWARERSTMPRTRRGGRSRTSGRPVVIMPTAPIAETVPPMPVPAVAETTPPVGVDDDDLLPPF